MAGEWRMVKLGSVLGEKGYIRGPFGSALRRGELKTEGIAVYEQQHAISNVRSFRYFVDEDKFDELSRFAVRANDLIISCSGTLGKVSVIKEGDPVGIISQALLLLRPDVKAVAPEYLYYFLSSPKGYHSITSVSGGSVQVNIARRSIIESIELPLPPMHEQQAIACILGTLDDRIELNRRMNETLEAIAQVIFKSWFVDFDPVRAKAAGEQPSGLAPHIADLFPDEFQESELGEIPKGWRIDTILTIAELLSGGTPRTKVLEYWNGNVKWVSAKDVRAAQGTFLLDTERTITQEGVDNSSTKILPELTTIVTARGTVGSYCILAEPMAMNQTNYGLKARRGDADYFVFFALGNLVSQLKQRAYGTIFDTVTTRTFETSQIVVPGDAVLTEFDQRIRSLMERICENLRQAHTLAVLRDTLLPRLISGELRVPAAERIVDRCLR